MIATIVISILTCLMLIGSILFFPKVKIKDIEIDTYWIVCALGALMILIFGCVSFEDVINGLFADSVINPIKILLLFFSMTFLSIFLDEVGLFHYLAVTLTKRFKSSQRLLFLTLYIMVAILTIFTSNDIVILTFTPFICYFSKNARYAVGSTRSPPSKTSKWRCAPSLYSSPVASATTAILSPCFTSSPTASPSTALTNR